MDSNTTDQHPAQSADAASESVHKSRPTTDADAPRDNADSSSAAAATPKFAELESLRRTSEPLTLDRFYDVNVNVWAELGHVTMPISELLELGEGAVLKLTRPIAEPVDLVAQGVKLARGEVVVVDDCFAIRITEIESSTKSRD